jgi:hypothetical protein
MAATDGQPVANRWWKIAESIHILSFSQLSWGVSSKRGLSMVSKNEHTASNGFGPSLAPLLDDRSPTEMIDESL